MARERYIPRGCSCSGQALVLIAKASHKDRWQDNRLMKKEREIYGSLGQTLNAEILGDHLKVMIPESALRENPNVLERLCDFEDAAHWLRECLHAGDLVAKYIDEDGNWNEISSRRWAADDGLEALLRGMVVLDEGQHFVSRLVLFSLNELEDLVSRSVSDGASQVTSERASESNSGQKDKGGRPLEYDWDAVKAYMRHLVEKFGLPGRGNRRFPTKAQLVDAILDEWASRDIQLMEPTVRRYVNRWLVEL